MVGKRHFDEQYVDLMKNHYMIIRMRLGGKRYQDFEDVMRENPTSFAQFVQDHKNEWIE